MVWFKGEPPHDAKLYRISFAYKCNAMQSFQETATFIWNACENAFIEVSSPEGFALYPEDGWIIKRWRPLED